MYKCYFRVVSPREYECVVIMRNDTEYFFPECKTGRITVISNVVKLAWLYSGNRITRCHGGDAWKPERMWRALLLLSGCASGIRIWKTETQTSWIYIARILQSVERRALPRYRRCFLIHQLEVSNHVAANELQTSHRETVIDWVNQETIVRESSCAGFTNCINVSTCVVVFFAPVSSVYWTR